MRFGVYLIQQNIEISDVTSLILLSAPLDWEALEAWAQELIPVFASE